MSTIRHDDGSEPSLLGSGCLQRVLMTADHREEQLFLLTAVCVLMLQIHMFRMLGMIKHAALYGQIPDIRYAHVYVTWRRQNKPSNTQEPKQRSTQQRTTAIRMCHVHTQPYVLIRMGLPYRCMICTEQINVYGSSMLAVTF